MTFQARRCILERVPPFFVGPFADFRAPPGPVYHAVRGFSLFRLHDLAGSRIAQVADGIGGPEP